jgi:signal peptidase II
MNISRNVKKKIFSKELIVPTLLVIFSFFVDRVSKIYAIKYLMNNDGYSVNDFLNFDLVWNTGIGFGLFSVEANITYHLISLLIFIVIIFLFYLITKAKFTDKILFSMIVGGAIGNLYDRLFYYAVPDFIDFHINQFHWFTFNIADIFISIGIILIIIKDLSLSKNEKN